MDAFIFSYFHTRTKTKWFDESRASSMYSFTSINPVSETVSMK